MGVKAMPLENYYPGDAAFTTFSACFEAQWAGFPERANLLAAVGGSVELARPIAAKVGANYSAWLQSSIAALDRTTPIECLRSSAGIQRLKTCLMRMP
ncbi:DUF2384 domain-containing protein [Solimonas terrae]|uniref:DUF2384 domain-containing protein n=1 Tax=Solimonas terrae TaxID=1396819 RepID=A0A6M2BQV1_9GAMM|nr:DUF2384 domain-containing protein [Solimonas terrae]